MRAAATPTTTCAWCGHPFTPNTRGRPRAYCSNDCRSARGHYVEDLPGWQARLDELEAAARLYGRKVPLFIVNEGAEIHDHIARGAR
jgi:hypothetical protein